MAQISVALSGSRRNEAEVGRQMCLVLLTVLLLTALLAGSYALAAPPPPNADGPSDSSARQSRDIEVEFGFAGEIVAGAWNPVRVTMRDQEAAELLLELDRGSLRGGEDWLRYRAPLAGGGGLTSFEDDLFIPAWQSFAWSVRTPQRVLASGSVERRRSDARPLNLIVSREVGAERALFGDEARVLEFYGTLPERAGAFDGVATLVVGDTLTPPRAQAFAAAAASGSTALLLEPIPAALGSLQSLVPEPQRRLGGGWLVRATREEARARLAQLPLLATRDLEAALRESELTRSPPHLPPRTLLMGFGLYALSVLLLVRFGGVPGLVTALIVALAASGLGFSAVRGVDTLRERSHSLTLSAGGLAQRLEQQGLFSLERRDLFYAFERHGKVYPLDGAPTLALAPTLTPDALQLRLGRFSSARFSRQPELTEAVFYWQGGDLVNASGVPLVDVFVIGRGRQPPLDADAHLTPALGDSLAPEPYTPLLPHLPRGSALARHAADDTDDAQLFVALPESTPAP